MSEITLSDGASPREAHRPAVLLACRLAGAIGRSGPDRDDLRTCVLGEIRAVGPFLADKPRILGYPVDAVPGVAGYRLGSDRGSPNHGSTLASKRVMAQIWSPVRVST
jgi:hypothetical protein